MTSRQIGTVSTGFSLAAAVIAAWASWKAGKETSAQAAQNQSEFSATMADCRQAAAECRQATAECRDVMSRWSTNPPSGGYGSAIAPR